MSAPRWRRWQPTRGRDPDRHAGRPASDSPWLLEHRLQQLEQRSADLERILRGLGEGVIAVDQVGILVHANRAAIELLGLDADGSLGSHMFVAVPHPEVCAMLESVMRGDGERSGELLLERPQGEQVLQVSVRPLRAASGAADAEPEGAVGVVRDVTDLRRLERARRDFFGNVSHELKTPIAAIRGVVETMLDDPDMEPAVRGRFLEGARRNALRLEALVTDLLSLARFDGGPRSLETVRLDLVTLVREVVDASEAAAASRRVQLRIEVADGIDPHLDADEEALRRAITNLVDNAVAHSDEGGIVRAAIDAADGRVELRVIDAGPGIPAEALDRVFERFYRVDAARSRARGGSGIGLSIVKHVVQAHGGTVWAQSESGRGSTFVMQLPVSRPSDRGRGSA